MLAIRETISYMNPQTLTIVVLAAFFSAVIIGLLFVFCCLTYQTEETELLPWHYIPSHVVQPEPSITIHNAATTNPATNADWRRHHPLRQSRGPLDRAPHRSLSRKPMTLSQATMIKMTTSEDKRSELGDIIIFILLKLITYSLLYLFEELEEQWRQWTRWSPT